MKYNTEIRTVESLVNDINKNKISFKFMFQRKAGQWNILKKTELIDSAITGMLIPEIILTNGDKSIADYMVDGIEYIVDGTQRLDTFRAFLNDEFCLSNYAHPVVLKKIDVDESELPVLTDVSYDVAGKKFSELDEDVQEKLKSANLTVIVLSQYDSKSDLKKIFNRLNNGEPLTPSQKLRSYMPDNLIHSVDTITESDFFTKVANITAAQALKADDQAVVVQCMMLAHEDAHGGLSYSDMISFLNEFSHMEQDDQDDLIKTVCNSIDNLSKLSEEKLSYLKKSSIPMVVFGDTLLETDEQREKYYNALTNFFVDEKQREEYKQYNSVSTAKGINVKNRIRIILALAGIKYEVIEEPEKKRGRKPKNKIA